MDGFCVAGFAGPGARRWKTGLERYWARALEM